MAPMSYMPLDGCLSLSQGTRLGTQGPANDDHHLLDAFRTLTEESINQLCEQINASVESDQVRKEFAQTFDALCGSVKLTEGTELEQCKTWVSWLSKAFCNAVLIQKTISSATAAQYAYRFRKHLEALGSSELIRVMNTALNAAEEEHPHAFLLLKLMVHCTKVLVILAEEEADELEGQADGEDNGGQGRMSALAVAQRDAALHRLLQMKWSDDRAVSLIEVIRELELTQEQQFMLVQKALRCCRTASLQHVPLLIHQLLLIASHSFAAEIVQGIISVFNHLEAVHATSNPRSISEVLQQVEATSLVHLSTAVKYNPHIVRGWLKQLQTTSIILTPFSLSVLFTLCQHHKLAAPVSSKLKKWVKGTVEDTARMAGRPWLLALSCMKQVSEEAVRSTLLRCIRHCACAGEQVREAILSLAEHLMSTQVDSVMELVGVLHERTGEERMGSHTSNGTRLVVLGVQMLEEMFERQLDAQAAVLQMCSNRLSQGGKPEVVLPYVLLLGRLCRRHPHILFKHSQQLEDCIGSLGLTAGAASVAIVEAIWPLTRALKELQNKLVLTLKKLMNSQDVKARLVAVQGFLYIIIQHVTAGTGPKLAESAPVSFSQASSSQISLSQMEALTTKGASLLSEIMGFLKKCTHQQAAVRTVLYHGLMTLLDLEPTVVEKCAQLLLPQLTKYITKIEAAYAVPPVQLNMCATVTGTQVLFEEPLADLLKCVRKVITLQRPSGESEELSMDPVRASKSCAEKLKEFFDAITNGFLYSEAESLKLDKGVEWDPSIPHGLLSQLQAQIAMGCLEVVMEDLVDQATSHNPVSYVPGDQNTDVVLRLSRAFELHQRLFDLARDVKPGTGKKENGSQQTGTAGGGGGKKVKAALVGAEYYGPEDRACAMSADCVARLCIAVTEDKLGGAADEGENGARSQAPGHGKLLQDPNFRAFVLRSALNLLSHAQSASAASAPLNPPSSSAPNQGVPLAQLLDTLASPLFTCCQLIIVTWRGSPLAASNRGRGIGGKTHAKPSSDSLAMLASKCILQLLKASTACHMLKSVLEDFHPKAGDIDYSGHEDLGGGDNVEGENAESHAGVAAAAWSKLPVFKHMTLCLLEVGALKEVLPVVECLALLTNTLDVRQQASIGLWVVELCQQEVGSTAVLKALLQLAVKLTGQEEATRVLKIAQDIKFVVGADNIETQNEGQAFPAICGVNGQALLSVTLAWCEDTTREVQFLFARHKQLDLSGVLGVEDGAGQGGGERAGPGAVVLQQKMQLEVAGFERITGVVQVLLENIKTKTGQLSILKNVLHATSDLYRVLCIATKQLIPAKHAPVQPLCREFLSLVSIVNRLLTPDVHNFLVEVQQHKKEQGVKESKASLEKESKLVGGLIFNIEDWEKMLGTLGKAHKMNLMKDAKRSTNRDYKIDLKLLGIDNEKGKKKKKLTQSSSPNKKRRKVGDEEEHEEDGEREGCGDDEEREDRELEEQDGGYGEGPDEEQEQLEDMEDAEGEEDGCH